MSDTRERPDRQPVAPVRRVVDRLVTGALIVVTAGWSSLSGLTGPFVLRPVSTCAGPLYRCTGLVDLGVGLASWGPAVVTAVTLIAVARCAGRNLSTSPAALIGLATIIGLQMLGQAVVPLGVVTR